LVAVFHGTAEKGTDGLAVLHQALHGAWFWVGIVALAVWLALRLVVGQEDAVARALFAKDCARTMEKLHIDLDTALAQTNPLPALAPIQEAVRRKFMAGWPPPPGGAM
jgi:hypothetical protein